MDKAGEADVAAGQVTRTFDAKAREKVKGYPVRIRTFNDQGKLHRSETVLDTLTGMLNRRGGYEADVTATRVGDEERAPGAEPGRSAVRGGRRASAPGCGCSPPRGRRGTGRRA